MQQFDKIQCGDKLVIFKDFYNRYHEILEAPKLIVLYDRDEHEYLMTV